MSRTSPNSLIKSYIYNTFFSKAWKNQIYEEMCNNENATIHKTSESILEWYWEEIWLQMIREWKNFESKSESFTNIRNSLKLDEVYEFFLTHHLQMDAKDLTIQTGSLQNANLGKIYTPLPIIKFIIEYLQNIVGEDGNHELKIADLACGSGRFLHFWSKSSEKMLLTSQCIFHGFDTDATALEIAQRTNSDLIHWYLQDSLLMNPSKFHYPYDIIVGNPPYIESRMIPDPYWEKLRKKYSCAHKKFDLSVVFIERILELLRYGGWAGLITSNKWLVSGYGLKLRKLLLHSTYIHSIVDVSHLHVFREIDTYPIIIFFQKLVSNQKEQLKSLPQTLLHTPQKLTDLLSISSLNQSCSIPQSFFNHFPGSIIPTSITISHFQFLKHIWDLVPQYAYCFNQPESPYILRKGIHTGNVKSKLISSQPPSKTKHVHKIITSRDKVERFKITWKDLYINYDPSLINKTHGDYGSLREEWLFTASPKIVIKLFGQQLQAAMDLHQYYTNNSLIMLLKKKNPNGDEDDHPTSWQGVFNSEIEEFYYLLGVLNSAVISGYYQIIFHHTHVRGKYLQYYIKDLATIPIVRPTVQNSSLVQQISILTRKIETLIQKHDISPSSRDLLTSLEYSLNQAVMDLYKLQNLHFGKSWDELKSALDI